MRVGHAQQTRAGRRAWVDPSPSEHTDADQRAADPLADRSAEPLTPGEVTPPGLPNRLSRALRFGPDPRRGEQWTKVFVAILVANVGIALVSVALLVSNSGGGGGESASAPGSPAQAAPAPTPASQLLASTTWMRRELPDGAVVVADAESRANLVKAGFAVRNPAELGASAGPDYIVSTRSLRAAARSDEGLAEAVRWSTPIAVFGAGASSIVVRQTTTILPAQLAADRAADAARRRAAERELLANPAITVSASAAAILRSGGLDMRSATVLAVLADHAPIRVQEIVVDPAERAAGLPARRVVIYPSAAGSGEVGAVLAGLTVPFRPIGDDPAPGGGHRLSWSIQPDPDAG